jgi:hypothetical protein
MCHFTLESYLYNYPLHNITSQTVMLKRAGVITITNDACV